MVDDKLDMSLVNAIAFDPYTHGYYSVSKRVGEAFKDGLQLKKQQVIEPSYLRLQYKRKQTQCTENIKEITYNNNTKRTNGNKQCQQFRLYCLFQHD